MYEGDPNVWRTTALILAAVGQTLFVLFYMCWPWWNDFLGRALFFKAVAMMLLIDFGLAARIYDIPGEDWLFTGMYILFTLGVWVQFAAFTRVFLRGGTPSDRDSE